MEAQQNLNNLAAQTTGGHSSNSNTGGTTMNKRNKGNRGQGTGSISVNPSGTFRAQICLPGGDRTTKSFRTKRDAQHWLDEQFQAVQSGLTSDNRKITVREFAEHWLAAKKTNLRTITWRDYSTYINDWLLPALGDKKVREIKVAHLTQFYAEKEAAGRGLHAITYCHRVIRGMFEYAIREGIISANPARYALHPTPETSATAKGMNVFSPEQVNDFLNVVEFSPHAALYHLAIRLGLRQGELLGLTWSAVNFTRREIRIDKQMRLTLDPENRLGFTRPKTISSIRTLTIPGDFVDLLQRHRNLQQMAKTRAGQNWQENNLVFASTVGTFVDMRNLTRDFKMMLKTAGLPDIRFHDLRHTAASIMLMNGIPIIDVARILGHASPTITLKIYGHFIPRGSEGITKMMEEAFKRPTSN
jgi:integrase